MSADDPNSRTAHSYRVFLPVGKTVAVFTHAQGDLQTLAGQADAPLSAFIEAADFSGVSLRIFTPTREKGESDSAAVAALAHLFSAGQIADVTEVQMGGKSVGAQLCGGEWLLLQGDVTAAQLEADLSPIGLSGTAWTASAGRANLVVQVPDLATLDAFTPDNAAISDLNRATDTTGLILYTLAAEGREDVSFRAFGPLKGFSEDAASSNMFACLTGVLAARGQVPAGAETIRGAQRQPGQFARLTAQFVPTGAGAGGVWVGGKAELTELASA
ncbi:PhzF family phenazine biosynthesis protein [Deinococcus sp. QL22]|uniref:PhzF family phenazine biosynthesis protein n=1 Tax=Deinococcus sp. QL22 TaxID=2939437 RepID=UPI002016CC1B|nr:PhzF family phenazine biosynthesis protein [Deinococcus sp. QL22]UQN06579.1 PhzF family phenazine biosynthesis protein [Deinococcus sp. QL22]